MPIEVIAADLAGVMVDDGFGPVVQEYGQMHGADMDRLIDAKNRLWVSGLSLGRMSEEDYWNECFRQAGVELDGSLPGIKSGVRRAHRPRQEMFDYFRGLRIDGVRTALFTNTAREWLEYWKGVMHLDRYFDAIVASCDPDMAVRKENPEFFARAANALGVEPGRIAYTDDIERNVSVAGSYGLNAFHYKSPRQAVREFGRLRRLE